MIDLYTLAGNDNLPRFGELTESDLRSLDGINLDVAVAAYLVGRKIRPADQGLSMYDIERKRWVTVPKFHRFLDNAHAAEEVLLLRRDGADYFKSLCDVVGSWSAINIVRASAKERCRACLLTAWRSLQHG